MATLASLLIKVGVTLDGALQVEDRLRGLKGAADGARGKLGAVGDGLKSLAAPAAAMAAAIGAAAAGVFKFVETQAGAVAALLDTAKAVGIGVEEYQRLEFAAVQSGVSQEQLKTGMIKFNATLLDMARGGGEKARETLDKLGISLLAFEGKTRTEQIGLIGDALSKVGNEAERSALAATLFGKTAGPQMAQLLAEGTEGLAALTAAAEGVLSEDDVARAAAFDDQLAAVGAQIDGVFRGIAVDLLPIVSDLVAEFSNWISENDELIRQDLQSFVSVLGDVVRGAGIAAGATANAVRGLTESVGEGISAYDEASVSANRWIASLIDAEEWLGRVSERQRELTGEVMGGISALVSFQAQVAVEMHETRAARQRNKEREPSGTGSLTGPGAKSARKGGGGGGAKEPRESKEPTFVNKLLKRAFFGPETVTHEEAVAALLSGSPSAMQKKLTTLAAASPSTRDVKPTVAMDVYITNVDVKPGAIQIQGADPARIGSQVIDAFRTELGRTTGAAGQLITGAIVR